MKPDVREIAVDLRVPTDGIGLVFSQPFVQATDKVANLKKVLEVALGRSHGCGKTHFTVFPENSVPGIGGIDLIQRALEAQEWPTDTVVLGGVEALSKSDYSKVCQGSETPHERNIPACVGEGQRVNCMVTWTKTLDCQSSPVVRRWVQPKLRPALAETKGAEGMFEGGCVDVFQGRFEDDTEFRFLSVICFDWVAPMGEEQGISSILNTLNSRWHQKDKELGLHMVFVLECNNEPNHSEFLAKTVGYFHDAKYPFVQRRDSVVVFANNAEKSAPGRCSSYGHSGLVFSSDAAYDYSHMPSCPPSYAIKTRSLRGTAGLGTLKDALFRENGACIHSLRMFDPKHSQATAVDRRIPLLPVVVHSMGGCPDPRVPGRPVPAIVKWANDVLDCVDFFPVQSPDVQAVISANHSGLVLEFRNCAEHRLAHIMEVGSVKPPDPVVDQWSSKEEKRFAQILHALTLLSCFSNVTTSGAQLHGYLTTDDHTVIDVVVVQGTKHLDNVNYADPRFQGKRERKTLIISCDELETPFYRNKDKRYTETSSNVIRCGFYDLKDCLSSPDLNDFERKIWAIIREAQ